MRRWLWLAFAMLCGCSAQQETTKAPDRLDQCEGFEEPTAEQAKAHMEKFGCPPCPCSCVNGRIECASCPPCGGWGPPEDSPAELIERWEGSSRELGSGVKGRPMFVTAEVTYVCPTMAQAVEGECGNSVEDPNSGLKFRHGERVSVTGDGPVEGYWRAIRYTKLGRLAGWVSADEVAPVPDLAHVDAFLEQHSDAVAIRADYLKLATEEPPDDEPDSMSPLDPAVLLAKLDGKETALVTDLCLRTAEPEGMPLLHHACLTYADCDTLDYVCEEGSYCDEVHFVLEKHQPIEVRGAQMPAKRVRALADRFGVFTSPETCDE